MTLISWLRARRQGYGSWRSKNIQWLIVSALNLQAVPFWSIVLKDLVFRLRHGHGAVDSEKVCGNLRRGPASLKSTPRPLSQNLQLQFVDATIHTTQHNRHTHTHARARACAHAHALRLATGSQWLTQTDSCLEPSVQHPEEVEVPALEEDGCQEGNEHVPNPVSVLRSPAQRNKPTCLLR